MISLEDERFGPLPHWASQLTCPEENPLVPDYRTDLFSSPASVAKPRGARGNDPTMIHKEGKSEERENFLGVAIFLYLYPL